MGNSVEGVRDLGKAAHPTAGYQEKPEHPPNVRGHNPCHKCSHAKFQGQRQIGTLGGSIINSCFLSRVNTAGKGAEVSVV
eukprot:scaffold180776_cov36-Cyclotella_meneghiniana.AAC.1